MSWDIVLFNSKEVIVSVGELDESKLEPTNFAKVLECSFKDVTKQGNHREIIGEGYSIEFITHDELLSNTMLSIYGEKGLFELVKLAKEHTWQIYDTALEAMIDLEKPEINGLQNHRKYVKHVLKDNT